MPRSRSEKSIEAEKLYRSGKRLTEISKILEVPDGTVRRWKSDQDWDRKITERSEMKPNEMNGKPNVFPSVRKLGKREPSIKNPISKVTKNPEDSESAKTNTDEKYSSLKGNKNAVGNKGGLGGPPRNKKAVRTHEYVTVFFTPDIIDEEEQAMLDADWDKYTQQIILIETLKIREKRILQEIRNLKNFPGGMVFSTVTKNKGKTATSYHNRNKDGEEWDGSTMTVDDDNTSHVARPVSLEIAEAEDRLTRVQGRLQRAIEVWHKMEMDDEKLDIDKTKLELYRQKILGQYDIEALVDDDDLGLD